MGRLEPCSPGFGEFSSQEQATFDARFTSAELRLVEIWPGRALRWVYAEQFLTERAQRPFRQRIYRFSLLPDGRILMAELTMPRATDFARRLASARAARLPHPQQLSLREGCEIWLTRH